MGTILILGKSHPEIRLSTKRMVVLILQRAMRHPPTHTHTPKKLNVVVQRLQRSRFQHVGVVCGQGQDDGRERVLGPHALKEGSSGPLS